MSKRIPIAPRVLALLGEYPDRWYFAHGIAEHIKSTTNGVEETMNRELKGKVYKKMEIFSQNLGTGRVCMKNVYKFKPEESE